MATYEWDFRKLKIIINYLREITGQNKLSSLTIPITENEIANKIDFEDIIDEEFTEIKRWKSHVVFFFFILISLA